MRGSAPDSGRERRSVERHGQVAVAPLAYSILVTHILLRITRVPLTPQHEVFSVLTPPCRSCVMAKKNEAGPQPGLRYAAGYIVCSGKG